MKQESKKEFEELKKSGLLVGKAWGCKELFREFWNLSGKKEAKVYFDNRYNCIVRTNLKPLIKKAKMLKKHLPNILGLFQYKIGNATSEGLNSKIQTVKSNARGFRSFGSFRISILFHCGKLDMQP